MCNARSDRAGLAFWTTSLLILTFAVASRSQAERLPLKAYTSADELPHDSIKRIIQDSQGFIWLGTPLGLCRFDGYRFTTYGMKEGLSYSSVNDLVETRRGVYWVATNGGGVCRFNPRAAATAAASVRFKAYAVGDEPVTNRVNVLYEDRAGRLWAGSDGGLFGFDEDRDAFVQVRLGIEGRQDRFVQIWAFAEDREGSLWIGSGAGLTRRLPDGNLLNYSVQFDDGANATFALLLDSGDRLWMGTKRGLIVMKPDGLSTAEAKKFPWRRLSKGGISKAQAELRALPDASGDACLYTSGERPAHDDVRAIHRSADGVIRICAIGGGMIEFDGKSFRRYTTANGLSNDTLLSLLEDRDGNLWIGSENAGVMKLTRNGFTTYDHADGLGHDFVSSVFESQAGELCVMTGEWRIHRFEGDRFTAVRPNLPPQVSDSEWRPSQVFLQDHAGEWWIPTNQGLFRFPKVEQLEQLSRIKLKAHYTKKDGLADDNLTTIFEDSRGDIWMASVSPAEEVLTRWERASGKFYRYSDRDGLPPFNPATCFYEDASKNLWIGFRNGGLACYRDGRFRLFTEQDGLPAGIIGGITSDQAGRLWLATNLGGLIRIDNPSSESSRLIAYTTAEGLSSNHALCVIQDNEGRIYAGVGNGIDRLDPATGQIKHYTFADGLRSSLYVAYRDRKGALWLGTAKGLSKLIPEYEQPSSLPPTFISGMRISGVTQSVSDFGEASVQGLVLEPHQNQIQIDFFALSHATGQALQYQYKLDGPGVDWSAPTVQRTVNLSLSPGGYRFLVRAASADGSVSPSPAVVSFTILRPIWQRWWFIAIAGATVGAAIYLSYRYRVARLIELERVRTRIATDLHDDIGSNLSLIAMLSEVARNQAAKDSPEIVERLALVARTSLESVDAMSDIVWAVNPKRDHLHDLTERMRRFASDTFTARDIEFEFSTPDASQDIRLGADLRRQVYMIFKESVNNIAKHSRCTQADIGLGIRGSYLILKLSDNGKGFDIEKAGDGYGGNGLTTMRRRAETIGGTLEIVSQQGKGTIITLKVRV